MTKRRCTHLARCLYVTTLIAILQLTAGCQSLTRIGRTKADGSKIVLAANAYTLDAIASFPTSLSELVSAGLLESIPQCRCADGKLRDFVYIPGFTVADSYDNVILATPVAFDEHRAIIFRIDTRPEVVGIEKRTAEIQKSHDELRKRHSK